MFFQLYRSYDYLLKRLSVMEMRSLYSRYCGCLFKLLSKLRCTLTANEILVARIGFVFVFGAFAVRGFIVRICVSYLVRGYVI